MNNLHDIQYILIMALVFLAVVLLSFGLFHLFYNRNMIAERLAALLRQQPKAEPQNSGSGLVDDQPQGLTVKISKPLTRLSPTDPTARNSSTRIRLIQAGLRSKKAYFNFLACKVIGATLLPGVFVLSMIFFKATPERILIIVALALIGFFLPDLVLFLMSYNRKQELIRALPDALDLMVVCVEAGLGLDMTFKRVGDEIRVLNKDLSDEFMLTNLEVRSGLSRQESFKNMAMRTGVPEISQLMSMLNQTNRFGTSLANALRVHSDAMRVKRRQTAEEIAAKAAVKLLFPLVFFIFPALFIVLLGPGVIQIIRILLPTMQGG